MSSIQFLHKGEAKSDERRQRALLNFSRTLVPELDDNQVRIRRKTSVTRKQSPGSHPHNLIAPMVLDPFKGRNRSITQREQPSRKQLSQQLHQLISKDAQLAAQHPKQSKNSLQDGARNISSRAILNRASINPLSENLNSMNGGPRTDRVRQGKSSQKQGHAKPSGVRKLLDCQNYCFISKTGAALVSPQNNSKPSLIAQRKTSEKLANGIRRLKLAQLMDRQSKTKQYLDGEILRSDAAPQQEARDSLQLGQLSYIKKKASTNQGEESTKNLLSLLG